MPLAFLATNKSVTWPSGKGSLASFTSVPIDDAYQSCPVLLIPHNLSFQKERNFVSVVSSVKLLASEV